MGPPSPTNLLSVEVTAGTTADIATILLEALSKVFMNFPLIARLRVVSCFFGAASGMSRAMADILLTISLAAPGANPKALAKSSISCCAEWVFFSKPLSSALSALPFCLPSATSIWAFRAFSADSISFISSALYFSCSSVLIS